MPFSEQHARFREALDAVPHLNAVIESALDAIIAMDAQGRILAVNDAFTDVFGYTREQVTGADMADHLVPEDLRAAHREGLARVNAGGEGPLLGRRVEIRGLHADGRELPIELALTRLHDEQGEVFFSGVVRDISQRVLAETALRESRVRIVEASDAARRRVERDLHDGAQQRLLVCAMLLNHLGESVAGDEARAIVEEVTGELREATKELRELARGIHPSALSLGGLAPALRTAANRCPVPVTLDVPAEGVRFPETVEASAYFMVVEALTNVGRGVGASRVDVRVAAVDGALEVTVSDDGQGGAAVGSGSGLRGLADRAAAVGGTFAVESAAGEGTTLRARLPL